MLVPLECSLRVPAQPLTVLSLVPLALSEAAGMAWLVSSGKAPAAESIAGKSPDRMAEHTPSSCHPTDTFAVQTQAPTRLLGGSMTLHQQKDPPEGTQPLCVRCCPDPNGYKTLPGAGIAFLYRETGTGGTCVWSARYPQIHWIRPEICCFGVFPAAMASGGCLVKERKAWGDTG